MSLEDGWVRMPGMWVWRSYTSGIDGWTERIAICTLAGIIALVHSRCDERNFSRNISY